MSRTRGESSHGCLDVSARAAGRYLGLAPDSALKAGEAGLLRPCRGGYDAAHILELGRRTFVTDGEFARFPRGSILLVQQSPVHWIEAGRKDREWREAYGWSTELTSDEALLSASGWWPVEVDRRAGVRAIVSTVSSFVVTLALVDASEPIAGYEPERHRVRFNVCAATADTPFGRALLRTFFERRVTIRRGSSFLLP